jgi:hypothetical protein
MVKQISHACSRGLQGLNKGFLVPEFLVGVFIFLSFKLTNWSIAYAGIAIALNKDLMATAAVITAVGGVPVALLTILVNKYQDIRNANSNPPS